MPPIYDGWFLTEKFLLNPLITYKMLFKKEITCKNSKLKILCDNKRLFNPALEELKKQRTKLEQYIGKDKDFLNSLEPVKVKENAPKIAKLLSEAGEIADVGPMAAVAGTIAELVCKKLISKGAKTAVVENGGDIFCYSEKPVIVGIFSGMNKKFENIAFQVKGKIAICSSSSKMGHSYSEGNCDLATVFSKKGNIADAAATAVCNKVKNEGDVQSALEWGIGLKEVEGILIIKNNKIGMIGKIPRMIKADSKEIKKKITKFENYKF